MQALTYISENNPILGIDFSSGIKESQDEGLIIFQLPTGRSRPNSVRKRNRFSMNHCNQAILSTGSGSEALTESSSIPIGGHETTVSEETFRPFETATLSGSIDARKEAAQALFDLARVDEQRSMKALTRLPAETGPIRGLIATRLIMKNDFSKENTATGFHRAYALRSMGSHRHTRIPMVMQKNHESPAGVSRSGGELATRVPT